jgi:hypothetical protein
MSPRAQRPGLAIAALALLLAACGGGEESSPAVTGTDVGQTTAPSEPAEQEGDEAPPDESEGEEDTNQEGGFGEKDDVGQD